MVPKNQIKKIGTLVVGVDIPNVSNAIQLIGQDVWESGSGRNDMGILEMNYVGEIVVIKIEYLKLEYEDYLKIIKECSAKTGKAEVEIEYWDNEAGAYRTETFIRSGDKEWSTYDSIGTELIYRNKEIQFVSVEPIV